ncbi:MAG TPA: hypothetical protein DCQ04_01995 [Actinobacteria bacterium]|jgi:integrase|nr:hypothetical protein [Actinomycetota bacterium]
MTHVVTAPTLSQLPGGRKNSWRVRWRVDGRARTKHFPTKTAALAFLSKVNSARTSGRDFDDDTGAPILKSTLVKAGPTFAEAAQEIVRTSWDSLLGTSRHGLVAGLSQVISVTCSANIDRSTIYAAAFAQLSGVELDRTTTDTWRRVEQTSLPIRSVDSAAVAQIVAQISRNLDGSRAAPATVARRRSPLVKLLAAGFDGSGMPSPALPTRPRGTKHAVTDQVSPSRIGTAAEAAQVIGKVSVPGFRMAFWLMLYAGLRPAEAIGLRWSGVDVDARRLIISETTPHAGKAFTDSGKDFDVQQPKWRPLRSSRMVPMIDPLAELLAESGPSGQLVCMTSRQTHIGSSDLGHTWKRARNKFDNWAQAKLSVPYDLRHTHASISLNAGVPVRELAERLGHAPSQLLDTYADVVVADEGRWTDAIGTAFEGSESVQLRAV